MFLKLHKLKQKIAKKDLIYCLIILVISLTSVSYFLRYRIAETNTFQVLVEVTEKVVLPVRSYLEKKDFPLLTKNLSRDDLKKLIISETPILSQGSASDFEKVSALREWVFNQVPTVENSLLVENVFGSNNLPINKRVEIYREGLAGAWCGDTATALMDIYEFFGYHSYIVDMGNSSTADTHVITLVRIQDNENSIYSVQDAYLNYSFVYKSGRPMGYFGLLALLRGKNTDQVLYAWGKSDAREEKPYLLRKPTDAKKVVKVFPNGNVLQKQEFPIYNDFLEKVKPLLESHNYPPDLIYLNLFPFSVSGKDKVKAELMLRIAKSESGTFCQSREKCDPIDDILD